MIHPHETWDVVDSTKLRTFMDCPRQYFYRYVLGWTYARLNHNDLRFGSAWHRALAYCSEKGSYEDVVLLQAYQAFMEEYRSEFEPETDDLFDKKNPSRAMEALISYAVKYKDDFDKYEVVHRDNQAFVEVAGVTTIHPDLPPIYFKLDTVFKNKETGKYFVMERKTGTSLSRTWRDQWGLSTQIGTYLHVLRCVFEEEELEGARVDGVFFGAKTKYDMERIPVNRGRDSMQVWLWSTIQWLSSLVGEQSALLKCNPDAQIMEAFPLNPECCTKYFGCAYFDFCTAWPNPLRQCEEPPMDFKVEFWDPREEFKDAKVKMEV